MEKEFNLSEKIDWFEDPEGDGKLEIISAYEVKEFIKRLKEELHFEYPNLAHEIIDKLAGDKLI